MKKLVLTALITTAVALPWASTLAQGFNSGSDGSMGPLNVTVGGTVMQVPPDGKFHFTTITIGPGADLRFTRNALNTPVYLLATGDVILNGDIDVSGAFAPVGLSGGAAGPGAFDGGPPNGAGKGPGGGLPGPESTSVSGVGTGTYAHPDSSSASTNKGAVYGSPLLIPMVGGSGGGGNTARGGGGGGGGIVIASSTRIEMRIESRLRAVGGLGLLTSGGNITTLNAGSGGAIRLVAPVVAGNGLLDVAGGATENFGRVRIDTIDRTDMQLRVNPAAAALSVGSYMTVFGQTIQRLDIVAAADTVIPEGTNSPVIITLPFGSNTNRTVTVQARNFNASVPVEVVLTPNTGLPQKFTAQIDNAAANPATVSVPVAFPINTPVTVNAWVR